MVVGVIVMMCACCCANLCVILCLWVLVCWCVCECSSHACDGNAIVLARDTCLLSATALLAAVCWDLLVTWSSGFGLAIAAVCDMPTVISMCGSVAWLSSWT